MCKQLYQWGAHKTPFSRLGCFLTWGMFPQKFLKHYYSGTSIQGYSLRASSAFGGNREKLTHERHVRGDAKAGGVGEKGELATITSKFSFPYRKKTGTLQSAKTVTANMFFFYRLDMERQHVHSNNNSTLWFSFRLHLKSRPHSED